MLPSAMSSSFKLLHRYEFLHKAELDLIKLQSEKITAHIADSNTVNIAPYYAQAIGGIKIYVDEADFERASEVLSRNQIEDEPLKEIFAGESFEPAIRCPNCNSPNIFREQSILSGLFFLVAFFLPVSISKNKYRCVSCDHQWEPERH